MTNFTRLTIVFVSAVALAAISVSSAWADTPAVPSVGDVVPIQQSTVAGWSSCSLIDESISGVDLCFDPSVVAPRWIKLQVSGPAPNPDLTGEFPSGWGIRAQLPIQNRGTEQVVIDAGTTILSFTTAKAVVDVVVDTEVIVPPRQGDEAGYATVTALFDSEDLQPGLNHIAYVVNPGNDIVESNISNNSGTLRLFHPSAYPRVVINEVILPDYVQLDVGLLEGFTITVKGTNLGGDMTRGISFETVFKNKAKGIVGPYESGPLQQDGDFEFTTVWPAGPGTVTVDQSNIDIRFQDESASPFGPYAWASIINTDTSSPTDLLPLVGEDYMAFLSFALEAIGNQPDYFLSPMEIGSEVMLSGSNYTHPGPFTEGRTMRAFYGDQWVGKQTPEDYDGDAIFSTNLEIIAPVPHAMYPSENHVFNLTSHPPVLKEDWQFCNYEATTLEEYVDLNNKLSDQLIHRCFGISHSDGFFGWDTNVQWHQWVDAWADSFLRFRWLPAKSQLEGKAVTLQVSDLDNVVVHEVAFTPFLSEINDPVFTGITVDEFQKYADHTGNINPRHYDDIYEYYLSEDWDNDYATSQATAGYFNQYVYDGPPLEPGIYNWRVTTNVNAEAGSEIWSELVTFTINALPSISDQLPALKTVFRGEVTNTYTGGFTVATESGFVNVRTDDETIISSGLTGIQPEVPIGWKVHVWSEEVPYIVGKTLVPYEAIPIANSVEQFVTNRSHKRCTVIGQAESGRSAVTCDDGDYIELNESDLPSGASTIVLVKDHKECEVFAVSSSGVASLECEDGEVVTLDQPLKTGQVILIPGKSAKLISTANRLYDRINEFKISAMVAKDQQLTEELDEYGAQINADFDAAFAEVLANASAEVQDFLQTVTVLDDMITKLTGSFISGDNDFIFDGRDISELALQLQIFADSYENMVDLMVAEMLAEMPQETRDTTISSIKSQSGPFISDMKTELEQAVYFLNQGNLIEAISVMDGAMSKEEQWQQEVLIPATSSTMAFEAIAMVEQDLVEYGDSLSEENRAGIEQKLQALKTAVSNGESNLQTLIDELYKTIDTAWESYEGDNESGGQNAGAEARALEAIAEVDNSIAQYGESLTAEKRKDLEQKLETLKTALANGEPNLQPLIDDLYEALGTAWVSPGNSSGGWVEGDNESGGQNGDSQTRALEAIAKVENSIVQYGAWLTDEKRTDLEQKLETLKTALANGETNLEPLIDDLFEASSTAWD